MNSEEKGGLKDRLKQNRRIFLLNKNRKKKKEKKLKEEELKKNIENKKKRENISYRMYKSSKFVGIKNKKVKVEYKCKIEEYFEYYDTYGISNVYSNDGEIMAKISYDEYGNPYISYYNDAYDLEYIKTSVKNVYNLDFKNKEESNINFSSQKNTILKLSSSDKEKEIPIKPDPKKIDIDDKKNIDYKINQTLNKDINELQLIKYNIDLLNNSSKGINSKKREEELKSRYITLINEIGIIKNKYNLLKENSDYCNFDEINDYVLWDSLNYFSCIDENAKDDNHNDLYELKGVCESEYNKLEDILFLTKKNSIKEKNSKKLNSYSKISDKTNHVLYIDNLLKKQVKDIEKNINDMSKKVDKIDKVVIKNYKITSYSGIFKNMGKLFFGFLTLPFTTIGIGRAILGNAMLNNGIRGLRNSIRRKEEENVKYLYKDFSNLIHGFYSDIDKLNYIVNNSLSQINYLKQEFNEKFNSYSDTEEYKNFYLQIDNIEQNLLLKKEEIKKQKAMLEENEKKNKVKMKKLDEYKKQKS